MEMPKEILTFESVDEILWCDHSNETSSGELSHGIIHILGFCKNEIWDSSWIFILGTLGSERVNQILSTSNIRNMWKTMRRICTWIFGLKGLTFLKHALQATLVLHIMILIHFVLCNLISGHGN